MRKRTLLLFLIVSFQSMAGSPTFNSIPINSDGNSRGYWEFLPEGYGIDANEKYPVVIFFHGLGEGGNGDSDLHEVLIHGPPKIINANLSDNVFVDNNAIMLAPQVTNNTWWNDGHIRPFLDYVIEKYQVDENRIYFTGLSAGSSGINDFLDDDPQAHQIAATTVLAVRGVVTLPGGGYLAELVPYWGLTAIGDASNTVINSVNNLAGFLNNNMATDVMDTYPGSQMDRTAYYEIGSGWVWQEGVDAISEVSPKVTLYPGSSHFTWEMTYNNVAVWNWLFSQVKPSVTVSSPTDGSSYLLSDSVEMNADVIDMHGQPVAQYSWSSSIDGFLGSGDLLITLSEGIHTIEVIAIDSGQRGKIQQIEIEIIDGIDELIYLNGFESQ